LYEVGGGVDQDESRASALFDRACSGGVARGCNSLGILYQEGRGVRMDEQRAAGLYEKSCTAGYTTACTNLGLLYLKGSGGGADERRAAELFDKACDGEDAAACSRLGALYSEGRGVTKSAHHAALLFKKACALGDDSRCPRQSSADNPRIVKNEQPAAPPDLGRRFHLLATLGGQVGGEKLLEVSYNDGSTSSLDTGAGLVVAAGGVLEPFGGRTHVPQLQATLGFNYASLPYASNAGASWVHWPLELLAFYSHRPSNLRIGGGIQYQLGIELRGEGALSSASTPFENSLGWVVQGDWRLADLVSFYLRYTFIDYRPVGTWSHIPGGSFGFGMSLFVRTL
jgi:hypothetical protein